MFKGVFQTRSGRVEGWKGGRVKKEEIKYPISNKEYRMSKYLTSSLGFFLQLMEESKLFFDKGRVGIFFEKFV